MPDEIEAQIWLHVGIEVACRNLVIHHYLHHKHQSPQNRRGGRGSCSC